MEIVTSWYTLIQLAKELGRARLSGNVKLIQQAKKAHDKYAKLCLEADRMIIGNTSEVK